MITSDRTDEEILARIEEVKDDDWMGTHRGDLISALSFEAAVAGDFLTEKGVAMGEEHWLEDPETPQKAIADYLDFAVDKASGHRGLSAGRSIDHMRAWVWLIGDEAYASVDWDDYAQYGMPILKQIAMRDDVEYAWPTDDEEVERMAEGKPCEPDCMSGCGG